MDGYSALVFTENREALGRHMVSQSPRLQSPLLGSRTSLTALVKFHLQEISHGICSLNITQNSGSGLQAEQIN